MFYVLHFAVIVRYLLTYLLKRNCYSVVSADAQRSASATAEEIAAQFDIINEIHVDGGL